MSLTKDTLRIIARYYPLGNRALYEHLYEETIYGKKLNRRSLSVILSRLKKNGVLKNENGQWSATSEGKVLLNEKEPEKIQKFFSSKTFQANRAKSKKLIVIFDIPEKRKRYREWLRMELIGFGFIMIQKSVWLGPGLPEEFVKYLEEERLMKHLRFFQATEKDLI